LFQFKFTRHLNVPSQSGIVQLRQIWVWSKWANILSVKLYWKEKKWTIVCPYYGWDFWKKSIRYEVCIL